MNRRIRRLLRFGRGSEEAQAPPHRPPTYDEPDPRAKSTGHGKVTADKWNQ